MLAARGDGTGIVAALAADPTLAAQADENGATLLHHAAGSLDAATVEALLAAGADARATDRLGGTPLHQGCDVREEGDQADAAALARLLDAGAEPGARDGRHVTPLHVAVRARFVAAVRLLLARGADVDAVDRGRRTTPLRRAVANTGAGRTRGRGDAALAIARLLVSFGARPT